MARDAAGTPLAGSIVLRNACAAGVGRPQWRGRTTTDGLSSVQVTIRGPRAVRGGRSDPPAQTIDILGLTMRGGAVAFGASEPPRPNVAPRKPPLNLT